MRALRVALILAFACLAAAAQAEQRMFIISSNADGYGVDRCLENGAKCGAAAAAAFCRGRQFIHAASFRKVDRDEITGSVSGQRGACHGIRCDEFVAIVCAR